MGSRWDAVGYARVGKYGKDWVGYVGSYMGYVVVMYDRVSDYKIG